MPQHAHPNKSLAAPASAAHAAAAYLWPTAGVAVATACFWLLRGYVDKGQASLLYLPVVLACAMRFGFGPAVLGAVLSFLCWDFFFLPPFGTLTVADPQDWLSLAVFLIAAVVTARLASNARAQTQLARARETEIGTLFQASETISREVRADRLLESLAGQLQMLCRASRCLVLRRAAPNAPLSPVPGGLNQDAVDEHLLPVLQLAETACAHDLAIGFGSSRHLWRKALAEMQPPMPAESASRIGVYVPLRAGSAVVGVLHVGPRDDGRQYSDWDERLILTLANHAAVVIARDLLAEQAAQATALREADTLKDALLSLVSHELRTPLATIKASVSGLLQPGSDWEDAARLEALSGINREADRLSGVVSSLLDLSRLEAGAWRPCKDWCDLAEVAGTALDRLPPRDAARVEVNVAPGLPLVQADYTQMALVLTNLLGNAAKYTPVGNPIHLSIQPSLSRQGDARPGVTLCVRDFGSGLVPGEEERLFDRFYRGRQHKSGTIHGTGLGLALCHAVTHAHGGHIWAANAPVSEPRGAVFCVFLPQEEDK